MDYLMLYGAPPTSISIQNPYAEYVLNLLSVVLKIFKPRQNKKIVQRTS